MKKGERLFVRIDYRVSGTEIRPRDFEDHIVYVKRVASERFLIGGGFCHKSGGMTIFEAEDVREAKRIADDDPLIKKGLFRYELYEWELVVLSGDVRNE